ncbi:MAG: hypothetical protein N2039_01745, partial [Gemmataceae bacterium]|nr:hypothetical protein [Gemmataceae bacterium]
MWTLVSVGVVALAGDEGGPHRLDDFRLSSLWGATPTPNNDCNGIDRGPMDCPFSTVYPTKRCG